MHYQIARNGQMYGPYTMEDLQRYVVSGHVLLTDLAKSDDMPEWLPVSQLLGSQGSGPAPTSGYPPVQPPYQQQQPGAPAFASPFPDPPNLHWALLLLIDLVTCSLFQIVWNIILASWFRRVSPTSKALWLYIASAALLLLQGMMGQTLGLMAGRHGYGTVHAYGAHPGAYVMYSMVALGCWVVRLIARFTFRGELEQHFNSVDPVGLQLSPVMTFFFGGIYFQSQMNRINDIKRGLRYR